MDSRTNWGLRCNKSHQNRKWKWVGHIARMNDNRWTKRLTEWTQRTGSRNRGRQKTRWRDEIVKFAGNTWSRAAQDRQKWHQLEEVFALHSWQWAENG